MNSERSDSFNSQVGLHLRLTNNFSTLAQKALDYNISTFQFFLLKQENGKYPKLLKSDLKNFFSLKHQHFSTIYIHCSYWINPATANKNVLSISQGLLKKEIDIAKKLGIKHLVLHPGCATNHKKTKSDPTGKLAGIKTLTKTLNIFLKAEKNIEFLLENVAHGNQNIGNNLNDFIEIKKHLDYPERINYCLDLAHAFSYGYDLSNKNKFIKIVQKTIGIENIKLIHLNDSATTEGSKLDKHEVPGNGYIGKKILQDLINHPQLCNIPLILELPQLEQNQIKTILKDVNGW